MSRLTVTPEEHRLAIDMFVHDNLFLVRWLMVRVPWPLLEQHATVAVTFNHESDWSWRKLASFALHELQSIATERELTPMEQRVRSIAESIYDSGLKAAERCGVDLFPEDTDRQAARRQLAERFQRALEEVRPYTKGESEDE